jgi:putative O-methyltransferase
MTLPTASYLKVSYDLRPAKQIERRMIIDSLQILTSNGFPIRDYQYTGLGSIYFVDFILFHRILGMTSLLSVEHDMRIRRRVKFNKPFAEIDIAMKPIGDVIPTLDRDKKHLLWLDYDFHLNRTAVADSALAAFKLSAGSILLVTVDVEPPVDSGGPSEWRTFYEEQAKQFFGFGWSDAEFAQGALPRTNAQILFNAIESGLNARQNVRFIPLFNFLYADGHPMLTVGGMLGTDVEERAVRACNFSRSSFMRFSRDLDPFEIRIPKLTRKERLLLDHHMPCDEGWKPKDFEIRAEDIANYRELYRYYPAYAELLL